MRLVGLILLVAGSLSATPAQAQQDIKKSDAILAFSQVLQVCLNSLERKTAIADIVGEHAVKLHAATPQERKLSAARDPTTPVWASDILGDHLTIVEMTADKCVVTADQLPVDATVELAAKGLTLVRPDLASIAQMPGYWPVVRQWERIENGARYIIHIDAAEPGAPGHQYRFSLIQATVTRTATSYQSTLERDASHSEQRAQIIAALNRHANRYLHVAPRIPAEIEKNAIGKAGTLAAGQELLAVVDETALHNGNVGVYFFVDGIVNVLPAGAPYFIPYDALRGQTPVKGTFILSYGRAQVGANLIGKDEMIAILSDLLEATK